MQSKQTKTFQVNEPIRKVWLFLSDPRKVAPCLPGAQITEAVDDRTFKGSITVKIGPVSTSFKGEVKLLRLDEQNYEMELAGSGQDPRGGGGATMKMLGKLTELSGNATEVTGTTEVTVTGRLAQFGARMMEDVSNHLFQQFTKTFQERLAQEPYESAAKNIESPAITNDSEVSMIAENQPLAANPPQPPEPAPIRALPLLSMLFKNAIKRLFTRTENKDA